SAQLAQVRIYIGSDQRLRPGVFGRANINAGERCGVGVPLSAVLYAPEGAIVRTIQDGRIITRRVTAGLIAGDQIEVREGLSAGDIIVLRAGAFLRDGDRVRPIPADQ